MPLTDVKRTIACTVAFLALAIFDGLGQVRELVGSSFTARIVAVIDGDTVDAVPRGERRAIRIRLEGIDTPERGEPFSAAATRFTRVMLFGQEGTLDARDIDRYGRLVARIRVGNKDASFELLRAGLACHYTQYSSDRTFAEAQAQARRQRLGFWAAAMRPQCASPRPLAEQSGRATVDALFHGNTSTRVYHAPSCPNYNCRNCTSPFRTEKEAQAAGFRPAGDCLRR